MVRGLKMKNLNLRDSENLNMSTEAFYREDSEYLIRIEF